MLLAHLGVGGSILTNTKSRKLNQTKPSNKQTNWLTNHEISKQETVSTFLALKSHRVSRGGHGFSRTARGGNRGVLPAFEVRKGWYQKGDSTGSSCKWSKKGVKMCEGQVRWNWKRPNQSDQVKAPFCDSLTTAHPWKFTLGRSSKSPSC